MWGQAIINRKELHPTSTNKMTVAVETQQNRRLQHFVSDHGYATWRRLLASGVPEQIKFFWSVYDLNTAHSDEKTFTALSICELQSETDVRIIHNRGFSYSWMNLQFTQQLKGKYGIQETQLL